MSTPLRATFVIAVAVLFCPLASAQSLTERLEQVRHPLTLDEKGLSGPGAGILLEHARKSEFTLIGESHGNRETCQVTSWLLENLKAAGYDAFVTETGPSSTTLLAEAAQARGLAGVTSIVRETPFCVAFLHHQEEAALFAQAAGLGYACWGIDQEFMGAPRLILGELKRRAATDEARTAAGAALEKAWAGFKHYAQTGKRDQSFMFTAGADQWQQLEAAFPAGSTEREMIAHLRVSQRIYALYHRGAHYQNNAERIAFMKRQFSGRIQASPNSRVLLKLGSAHAGRGYSPFDQLDVGNHAAEMATARGGKSLHVLVLAQKSIDLDGKTTDHTTPDSPLRHFADPGENPTPQLIHLAQLRPVLTTPAAKAANPDLHNLTFRYDFALILPEFHRSESLVPLPG